MNAKIIIVHPTVNINVIKNFDVVPAHAIDPFRSEEVKKYYNDGEIHHVVCPYIIDYFKDNQIFVVGRDKTVLTLKKITEKFSELELHRYGLQNGELWASSIDTFHWCIDGEDPGEILYASRSSE